MNNIRKRLVEATLILVTHRLALGREMDQIVVLDDGRIAESGPHSSLMKENGYYRRVFNDQALAQEMEIRLK